MNVHKVNYSDELAISAGKKSKERDYWLNKLSGELIKSSFPFDFNRKAPDKSVINIETFRISGPLFSSLMKLSKGSDYTLFVILLAALTLLIHKYTALKDIIVGAPIFKQGVEGDFLNTVLALRNRIDGDMTFKQLLLQTRTTLQEAVEHQNYPMEVLLYQMQLQETGDGFPLFDIAALLQNIHERHYLDHIHLKVVFSFLRVEEHIDVGLEYHRHSYKKTTIQRISHHFFNLLASVLEDIDSSLESLDITSVEEKRLLLMDFNGPPKEFPLDKTINDFIASQAENNPGRIALGYEDRRVTYRQFNRNVAGLTGILREAGVRRNQPVGILMERSPLLVESILAVWQAGGAYIPIAPDYPAERIRYMMDDCQAAVLLTETGSAEKYSSGLPKRMSIQTGQVRKTAARLQITDFNALPVPDRSLVNYEKYHRYIGQASVKNCISLQATRGCPYQCAYCHKIWPKSHVVRSAENLFHEVRLLYDMGIRRFAFIDDIFNLDSKNSRAFFQMVIDSGLRPQFFFPNGIRGDLLTREYIDLMVKAGTAGFALALETASPRLQKLVGKNLHLDKLSENIHYICHTYPQVILELFTMHGFPTETEAEALMTLEFIKRHRWIHFPYIEILHIFKNTDMEQLALENGISREAILRSDRLAFHELPDTLPFDKSFTLRYQADYLNRYFLLKERLLHVLPHQMKVLSEDEMVQKYNSYLPVDIKRFDDFLEFAGISKEELNPDNLCFPDENRFYVPDLNKKMREVFPGNEVDGNALRVLLLDLSQFFSKDSHMLYDVVEPPLGLLYLMTYLKQQFGPRVEGKIAKSRNDFDSFEELKALLAEFKPQVIGIRTLNFFKDFFHQATAMIRQWGINAPIIAGGPYATTDYKDILQDPAVDLAVLGEGELTLSEVIAALLENNGNWPADEILEQIAGIAFLPGKETSRATCTTRVILADHCHDRDRAAGETVPAAGNSADLAYIIYTSGSTGKPKGAMVEHMGMMNHLSAKINDLRITPGSIIAQNASHTFDISVWQFFSAPMQGGKTVIYSNETILEPDRFIRQINNHCVTHLELVPSYLTVLMDSLENNPRSLGILEYLLVTGEEVKASQVKRWFATFPGIRMVNAYGPTEASDDITHFIMNKPPLSERIPVGRPVQNFTIHIVDERLYLCPIGVKGEICVSGVGVGRGYLNNPELTAKKFYGGSGAPLRGKPGKIFLDSHLLFRLQPAPVSRAARHSQKSRNSQWLSPSGRTYKRLYKTGDLGRWLEDGTIEFFGRKDFQVKIRGHRIELGEIEKKIGFYPDVKETVLIVNEESDSLNAFVTAGRKLEFAGLREYLAEYLPAYMIPEYFMQLEKLPLTPNGKIDRKALQQISITADINAYAPPENETQQKILEIWAEVLGLEKNQIGINANFFELGGHSLRVTSLVSKIHKNFDVKVPFIEVFKAPTIRGMASYIKEKGVQEKYRAIEAVEKKEFYTLSSPQARFYLLQQLNRENTAYNMSQTLPLDSSFPEDRLEIIFKQLIKRHESLRTSFRLIENEPRQMVHPEVDFKIDHIRASGEHSAKLAEDYIKPFDLSRAPLLRVALIQTGKEKLLVVDLHHIISDGISLHVLTTEFIALYEERQLAPLSVQYKDYACWQRKAAAGGVSKKMETYWLQALENFKLTELPQDSIADQDRPAGDMETAVINKDTYVIMEEFCTKYNLTKFSFMYSVFAFILATETGQTEITVGTPIANRDHHDLENIIGVFLNVILLRAVIAREDTLLNNMLKINREVIKALENSAYPYEELYYRVRNQYQFTNEELFTILFNYIPWEEKETIPGMGSEAENASPVPLEITPKYNVTVYLADTNEEIIVNIVYRSNRYRPERINRLITNYCRMVETVLTNENTPIADLSVEIGENSGSLEEYASEFDTLDLF